MSFEQTPVTPPEPLRRIKTKTEKIASQAALEDTQLIQPDAPTRKIMPEELEKQEARLEKIREEIQKEQGVSRIGIEATVIPEDGEDDEEPPSEEEDEWIGKTIGGKEPSLEDLNVEEKKILTSFAETLSRLAQRPKMPAKQLNEIAFRDILLTDKIEIMLNSFFPGMDEIAILPVSQREDLFKQISYGLAKIQSMEMHMSGKDLTKKVREMQQKYADTELRLFEYLKLGKREMVKSGPIKKAQTGIKYAKDTIMRLEGHPEVK